MRVAWLNVIAGSVIAGSLAIIALNGEVHAQTCAYRDGGYCVSDIASQTARKLGIHFENTKWEYLSAGDMAEGVWGGTPYLNYYEGIWNKMVQSGKATEQDRKRAFDEAKKAGGTKIGGVNLVVLSAMTLQQLVDKKVLTKDEAQSILNGARQRE